MKSQSLCPPRNARNSAVILPASFEEPLTFRSKTMKRLCLFVLIPFLIAGCNKGNTNAEKSFTIAVIPQGSTHEFWKSIHAGAMKASQDYAEQKINVNIIWKGPMREDDREQQVQVVE